MHQCNREERIPVFDARGIFVTYVCPNCEERKLSSYRKDIFVDPNYSADEPIEPEDTI